VPPATLYVLCKKNVIVTQLKQQHSENATSANIVTLSICHPAMSENISCKMRYLLRLLQCCPLVNDNI